MSIPSHQPTAGDWQHIVNALFPYLWSSRTVYTLSRTIGESTWRRGQAIALWTFPGHTASGGNWTVTGPTGAQHVTKVAESGIHTRLGVVAIHFSHWSAVDGLRLALTPGRYVVCVGHQWTGDVAPHFVDPELALRALDGDGLHRFCLIFWLP